VDEFEPVEFEFYDWMQPEPMGLRERLCTVCFMTFVSSCSCSD